ICEGESISPTVSVNDCYSPTTGYQWNFPSGTPTASTNAIPGTVTYPNAGNFTVSVQVTNACGTVNASRPLVVNAPPLANAGPDVSYCSGQSAPIGSTSSPGVTYQWNPTTNLSASNQSLVTATPSNSGN